jgi:eukaryotic-like serine/threonine-protein kinase
MKVDPSDWPLISTLYDQALALPAPQRLQWLQWLDGPSEAERVHRHTLERPPADQAHVQTRDFMQSLPKVGLSAETRAGPDADAPAESGRSVGPYRLLHELGHGGMGLVWLAERADGVLKRQVALKLPHAGLATHALAERLARERDILASLTHPHIARLCMTPA